MTKPWMCWVRRQTWLMGWVCVLRGHRWHELIPPPPDGRVYHSHLCLRCLKVRGEVRRTSP